MTADDQRIYSEEEFALILRKAAEGASGSGTPRSSREGLTLAEMRSAAEQAGIDPALVEGAARMLDLRTRVSTFERLIGGALRHEREARFRVGLDAQGAARVLSAGRLSPAFHSSDPGEASALGMMWKASGDGNVLSIVARPDAVGTSVSVVIDRRGTFLLTGVLTGLGMFMSLVVAAGINSVAPSLSPWVAITGIGGACALARAFWTSSSSKAQERIDALVAIVGRALAPDEQER